jgi:hypothetical protein
MKELRWKRHLFSRKEGIQALDNGRRPIIVGKGVRLIEKAV